MKKAVGIVSVLLLHSSLVLSASRIHSRRFLWDDKEHTSETETLHEAPAISQEREDRKLVFINNKAYNMSEAEEANVWEEFVEKGQVPKTDAISRQPSMDSLRAAMNTSAEDTASSEKQFPASDKTPRETPEKDILTHRLGAGVKASRFVADKKKAQLIERVDEEEIEKLRDTATTTEATERVASEAPTETSTVRYEYTQVSVLSFLWNEVRNIGELLGREMLGSVSGTLYYLWESVIKLLQANTRKVITDMSSDL